MRYHILLLAALAPNIAAPALAAPWTATYEFHAAGLRVLEAEFTFDVDGPQYRLEVHSRSRGLVNVFARNEQTTTVSGRWEGDTLVIDSGGFNDLTTLDKAGLPHSDQMTLNERMRLIDGGARLEDLITINDAASYTKPWSVRVTFKRLPADYWLKELVCTDKNPDAS
jgi:hypothetical protein